MRPSGSLADGPSDPVSPSANEKRSPQLPRARTQGPRECPRAPDLDDEQLPRHDNRVSRTAEESWEGEQRMLGKLLTALTPDEREALFAEYLRRQMADIGHALRMSPPEIQTLVRDALPSSVREVFEEGLHEPILPSAVPTRMELVFLAEQLQRSGRLLNGLPVETS